MYYYPCYHWFKPYLNQLLSTISSDKCPGDRNIADNLSTEISVPSETKDLNFSVFNMIARINEVKTLVKQTSWNCNCKFNITICNSNQELNNAKCQYECKMYQTCKKDYSWNPRTCIC